MPIHTVEYPSNDPNVSSADVLRKAGPLIQVVVSLPVFPGAAQAAAGQQVQPQQVFALIDTGASDSAIDEQLATNLQLPIIDRQTLGGVAGPKVHNVYMGQIEDTNMKRASRGRFAGVTLQQHFSVILGREFLQNTVFIYDGATGRIQLMA